MNNEITKEDMESYEKVRKSGITNMFDISYVEQLSGIDKKKILLIMKNYSFYMKKYNINKK